MWKWRSLCGRSLKLPPGGTDGSHSADWISAPFLPFSKELRLHYYSTRAEESAEPIMHTMRSPTSSILRSDALFNPITWGRNWLASALSRTRMRNWSGWLQLSGCLLRMMVPGDSESSSGVTDGWHFGSFVHYDGVSSGNSKEPQRTHIFGPLYEIPGCEASALSHGAGAPELVDPILSKSAFVPLFYICAQGIFGYSVKARCAVATHEILLHLLRFHHSALSESFRAYT